MLLKLLGEAATGEHRHRPHRPRGPLRGARRHLRRRHRLRPAASEALGHPRRPRPDPHGLPRLDGRGPRGRPLRLPDPRRGLTTHTPDQTRGRMSQDLLRDPRRRPATRRRRDQEGLPQAGPPAAPRRQPGPGDPGAVQGGHPRLRGADRPAEAGGVRPRRRPVRPAAVGGFGQGAGLLVHRHHGRVLRRRAAPAAGRGPRPRTRRGQDALIRLDARARRGGVRRHPRAQGRHRGALHDLRTAQGTAPGTPPAPARPAAARGEVAARPALVPRRGPHAAPVRDLPRLRHRHPRPLPRVLGRRPGPLAPHPHRQDPGRRRHRHPRPAHRRGRGRPRRRPGRRPLRRDPRRRRTPRLHPARRRPALHGHAADDRGGARHHARAADARGRPRVGRRTRAWSDVRPRHPARHPVRQRAGAARPRRARACAAVAATCRHRRRRDPDPARRAPGGAAARARRAPRRGAARRPGRAPQKSVFGRLRDAFNQHG